MFSSDTAPSSLNAFFSLRFVYSGVNTQITSPSKFIVSTKTISLGEWISKRSAGNSQSLSTLIISPTFTYENFF